MTLESEEQRDKRCRQRELFDGVAELYDATRRAYPDEIVDFMLGTAGLRKGSAVLEVGCGTGQLTEQLVERNLAVTAIDIGSSMVAAARRRLGHSAVRFEVVPFEEFDAPDATFDLIVSATAFHWVDPAVRFSKSARLLRADGCLAILATREDYDDPLGTALRDMWIARSNDGGAWTTQQKLTDAAMIASTGLFDVPIHRAHAEPMSLPTDVVSGVERTRATFLSWDEEVQRGFTAELREHLRGHAVVPLVQETVLSMARASVQSSDFGARFQSGGHT